MNNNPKIVWGVIVAAPKAEYWKNLTPDPRNIGMWCTGPAATQKSPAGHSVFNTRQEAEEAAKSYETKSWTYAAKKYPLRRNS